MSKQPHTAGPWRTAPQRINCDVAGHTLIYVDGQPPLAYVASRDDARLIAAAPDLLAALKALWHEVDASGNAEANDFGWSEARTRTLAAIAKAEVR
jgi:hypothetical protein